MAYVFLALAIGAEIVGTTFMKYSEGFTKAVPTAFSLLAYFMCHICFSKAVSGINLGMAYAIWCGVGIIVTAILSYFVFSETLSTAQLIGVLFILMGCIIMNLFS